MSRYHRPGRRIGRRLGGAPLLRSKQVGWVERRETHHRSPDRVISSPGSPAQSSGWAPRRTHRRNEENGQSRTRTAWPCFTALKWM